MREGPQASTSFKGSTKALKGLKEALTGLQKGFKRVSKWLCAKVALMFIPSFQRARLCADAPFACEHGTRSSPLLPSNAQVQLKRKANLGCQGRVEHM